MAAACLPTIVSAELPAFFFAGGAEKDLGIALGPLAIAITRFLHAAAPTMRNDFPSFRVIHLHSNPLIKNITKPLKIPSLNFRVFPVFHDATL